MAGNPYEASYEYGPDGRPIRKIDSRIPVGNIPQNIASPPSVSPSLVALQSNPIRQPILQSNPVVSGAANRMPVGSGYSVSGANDSGRGGYSNRTYYDPVGNVVASGISGATGRGGFVGAATDAQAATALQDRAAQSAAAQQNIASMNAGADAMRDLRATRLGISRGVLDRMEGRTDTAAAAADSAAQGAIPERWSNPFSMPGDSFQDTRGRQAEYGRAIEQAMTGDRRQQQGAAVALQGIAGLADQNRAGDEIASRERIAGGARQAGILKGTMDAQIEAAKQQFDRQKWAQQYGLDAARFNLDAANSRPKLSPYETELQQSQAKQQIDREQKQRTASLDLADLFAKTDRLHELSANTGLFAPAIATISRPFGGERSAQAEEFKSLSNSLAASLVKQLPGPLSEKELQFIKDQTVQLGNTPEGNRRILDNLRSFAVQHSVKNGVDVRPLVEQRGAALEAKGIPKDQIIATLRREFAGGY